MLYDNVKILCAENNISVGRLEKDLNFSREAAKSQDSTPYLQGMSLSVPGCRLQPHLKAHSHLP